MINYINWRTPSVKNRCKGASLLDNARVLFIFRCSKNWQKKSVHHHLLQRKMKSTLDSVPLQRFGLSAGYNCT